MIYLCINFILLNKTGWSTLIMCASGKGSNLESFYSGTRVMMALPLFLSRVGCGLGLVDLLGFVCQSVASVIVQSCRPPVFHSLKYLIYHIQSLSRELRPLFIFFRMEGTPFWDSSWLKGPYLTVSSRNTEIVILKSQSGAGNVNPVLKLLPGSDTCHFLIACIDQS